MIGYMGLVYGFLVDTVVMDESFTGLELIGALVILIMNLFVIFCKKRGEKPRDSGISLGESKCG